MRILSKYIVVIGFISFISACSPKEGATVTTENIDGKNIWTCTGGTEGVCEQLADIVTNSGGFCTSTPDGNECELPAD